jgi:hypothetical protein
MIYDRAPIFLATVALLLTSYAFFGIPGIVGIIVLAFLTRGF